MVDPLGTVLITGASSGIGEALAREIAANAEKLVIVARRRDRLEALAVELRSYPSSPEVLVQACDLCDFEKVDSMLENCRLEVGDVDVLINNAGFGDSAFFEETDWAKINSMLQLNISSLTYLTWRCFPGMVQRRRGGIINISSLFGLITMPGYAAYIGTKHFVTGFTEALRLEAAGTGVTVTQVCPGPVETEFHAIAGNRASLVTPKRMSVLPQQVAKESLDGFRAGKFLVVPGAVNRWLLRILAVIPKSARMFVLERWTQKSRRRP